MDKNDRLRDDDSSVHRFQQMEPVIKNKIGRTGKPVSYSFTLICFIG